MSITAAVVLGVYFGGLLLGLYRPIFALFSYLWIFYNDPSTNWWGPQVPDLRYSLIAAAVALIVTWWHKDSSVSWWSHGASKIIFAYALWMWIQTPWALDSGIHFDGAILFTKYAVLSYVIYKAAPDERGIEWFLWAHIAGCFIFGWLAFNAEVVTRLETIGGPGVDDSNLLAAHMVTGLVAAGFLFIKTAGWRRWIAFGTLPFIMNTIVLTQSRGGFLALVAGGLAAWYLSPKQYRRFVTIAGVLGVVLLFVLSNDLFWERISTVLHHEEDASAESRLRILGPQLQMFFDHPFGVGHRGNELLSPQYMPSELLASLTGRRSAHNTFMAALVDQGFLGGLLLAGMYVWGFFAFWRMKGLDKKGLPVSLGILRAAIGAGLASMIVSGLFLNLLKTEVQIWLISLTASLVVLCNRAMVTATVEKPQAAPARSNIAPVIDHAA
jgi:O-antigen ligase